VEDIMISPRNLVVAGPADEREARLPRWARDELHRLRMRLKAAEREAKEARLATNPAESLVLIPRFNRGDDIGLGDETVRFRRRVDGPWDEHFEVRVSARGIRVMAGRGPMAVVPVSSNVVEIEPWRYQ
jgi:hypothetical protein